MIRHELSGGKVFEAVDSVANINWFGDFAVPLGLFVISTVFTFLLFRASKTQARRDFVFQRDYGYAEEFIHLTEDWRFGNLLLEPSHDSYISLQQVHGAYNRACDNMSGNTDAVRTYLSYRWQVLRTARQRLTKDFGERLESAQKANPMLTTPPPREESFYTFEESQVISAAMWDMRRVIRDWPYPEKRRAVLTAVNTHALSHRKVLPTDMNLAIDRILLHTLKSDWRAVRWWRWVNVNLRVLADNYRYGRLPLAWENKRIEWAVNWKERRGQRVKARIAKAAKRERIEHRKIHEAARRSHVRTGQYPDWHNEKMPQP